MGKKVAKKILKWRAKQAPGAIMSPEKFQSIKAGARSGGAYDPEAVAGKQYWQEVMSKYAAAHCEAEPL